MTVKNPVDSTNFLVWKFYGKAQFSHNFRESSETMWILCLQTKFSHYEIS